MVRHLKFFMGEKVAFRDKFNLRLPPRTGTVIGFEDHPSERMSKRLNFCWIIRPDDGGPSEWREEDEVVAGE